MPQNEKADLELLLLGGLQVRSSPEGSVRLSAKKAKALLAYLALHPGQGQPREKLAALLWEDSGEGQARHSLRQTLTTLRKALPITDPRFFETDGDSISLAPGVLAVDVFQFEALCDTGTPEALAEAVEMYRGEFLEGFNPRAEVFEDWLMEERSRLRERAMVAMAALLDHHGREENHERCVQLAIRLLALDPLAESVHRTLMELYARLGRYGSALRQYRLCRDKLSRELDVLPDPETEALYETLVKQRREKAPPAAPGAAHPTLAQPPGDSPGEVGWPPGGAPISPVGSAELRQVTVAVVRMSDFAGLKKRLDAEALHGLVGRYYAAVGKTIVGCGGSVVKSHDGSVLALFGVPAVSGRDSQRAVHAASEIKKALLSLGSESPPESGASPPVMAGIGIASGAVLTSGQQGPGIGGVTGNPGGILEYTVTGDAVDRAGALARSAPEGRVLLSDEVVRGVSGEFNFSPWRSGEPSGESPPVAAPSLWMLEQESLGASTQPGTTFVGRNLERRHFQAGLEACLETGAGQTFLVRGEAGIGKTRLLQEYLEMGRSHGLACHQSLVLNFGMGTGQGAIRTLLRSMAGLHSREAELSPQWVLRDTELQVIQNDLLGLLQLPEQQSVFDALSAGDREQMRLDTCAALLREGSQQFPLLLCVEDVHWADPPTLAFLARMAATVNDCPALLVMTSRVEGEPLDPLWRGAMHGAPLTTIDLGPLREGESLDLAGQLADRDGEFARKCMERAGGNPLFLEQLLRTPREQGDAIPDSVQSIVWARLDTLTAEDRQAVQAASVMGQRFSLEALRHLSENPDAHCGELIAQRLVRPEGEQFLFTHALILEGIYASLLPSQRRELHARAAQWYKQRDPVLYAEQLGRAGDSQAAEAYLEAARVMAGGYRYQRALELARRGMETTEISVEPAPRFELLVLEGELLRESGEVEASLPCFRKALEVDVKPGDRCRAWIEQAASLNALDRHGESLEALERAETEGANDAGAEMLSRLHYLRGTAHFPLGQLDQCLHSQQQALRHARKARSPVLEAAALSGLGDAHYQRGRLLTALEHFDRCIALCREHGLRRFEGGNLVMRAMLRNWKMDLPGAWEDTRAALETSRQVMNRRGEALALTTAASLHLYQCEPAAAFETAQKCQDMAHDLGVPRFEAEAFGWMALAKASLGEQKEAEQMSGEALRLARELGMTYIGPWTLGIFALITKTKKRRSEALAEGERLLAEGCVSHNYLVFYQYAIEISLRQKDWDEAERYAQALEEYTRAEPLAMMDFYIARGRALARHGRSQNTELNARRKGGKKGGGTKGGKKASEDSLATLKQLRDQAQAAGLLEPLPALDAALGEGGWWQPRR